MCDQYSKGSKPGPVHRQLTSVSITENSNVHKISRETVASSSIEITAAPTAMLARKCIATSANCSTQIGASVQVLVHSDYRSRRRRSIHILKQHQETGKHTHANQLTGHLIIPRSIQDFHKQTIVHLYRQWCSGDIIKHLLLKISKIINIFRSYWKTLQDNQRSQTHKGSCVSPGYHVVCWRMQTAAL